MSFGSSYVDLIWNDHYIYIYIFTCIEDNISLYLVLEFQVHSKWCSKKKKVHSKSSNNERNRQRLIIKYEMLLNYKLWAHHSWSEYLKLSWALKYS